MHNLASGRDRRIQAMLQRLAKNDVEDTVSEADVEGWLKMLEAESAKAKAGAKAGAKPAAAAPRSPGQR
jgi:hypothetical protein